MQPLLTSTDSDGKYSMKDVEPGRYRLMVQRAGYARQEYGARGANRQGTTLTLDKGQNLDDLNFRLTPGGVISGRILDDEGEPVVWAQVQVLRYSYLQGSKQLTPFNGATTDDRGMFRMHSLAPGKYLISATFRGDMNMWGVDRTPGNRADEGFAATYYPGTSDPATAASVEVAAGGEIQNLDIRLIKTVTARVKGRIIGGNPAQFGPRTMISMFPRNSPMYGMPFSRGGPVDAKGNFELRGVSSGSYIVRAEQFDDGTRLVGTANVDVSSGNIEGVTLTLSAGTALNGSLKIAEGQGDLTRTTVYLRPKDSPMFGGGGGRVKDDGTFSLLNTYAGTYEVSVMGLPDDLYVKSIRYGQEDVLGKPLVLQQSVAGALEITVRSGAGKLTGVVINDKKEPVRGATVVLEPLSSDRKDLFKMMTTDQNGAYSLAGITPGDYRVYGFEDIETGAHQDRDYLKDFERLADKATLAVRESKTLQVTLIPAEKAEPR